MMKEISSTNSSRRIGIINKLKKPWLWILQNWCMICWTIGILTYLAYVFYIYVEIPFETYISKLYLVEDFYQGNITISSLLIPYSEHGMLAANLLFLLNLKIFKFSVLFESLVNAGLVAITGAVFIKSYSSCVEKEKHRWYYYAVIVLMTFFLFTCMQQGGGAMSLQIRFGLVAFIVVSYLIDKILIQKKHFGMYYIITILSVFLSINVFGTVYNFAAFPITVVLLLALWIKDKKMDLRNLGIIVAYSLSIILYLYEYNLMNFSIGSKTALGSGIDIKEFIESFLYWCGSCVLGRAALEDGHISATGYLVVGLFMLILMLLSLFLYFKTKMYKKTYLPIFCMGYFYCLFLILYLGRSGQGSAWFTSSWYTVHTKVASVSMIGIFLYAMDGYKLWKQNLFFASVGAFLTGFLLFGTYCGVVRLPYEKIWLKDKQAYFFVESKEEFPVDANGMTPLFQDPETSWNAICILKKYNLSLFRNYDAYLLMQQRRADAKEISNPE